MCNVSFDLHETIKPFPSVYRLYNRNMRQLHVKIFTRDDRETVATERFDQVKTIYVICIYVNMLMTRLWLRGRNERPWSL